MERNCPNPNLPHILLGHELADKCNVSHSPERQLEPEHIHKLSKFWLSLKHTSQTRACPTRSALYGKAMTSHPFCYTHRAYHDDVTQLLDFSLTLGRGPMDTHQRVAAEASKGLELHLKEMIESLGSQVFYLGKGEGHVSYTKIRIFMIKKKKKKKKKLRTFKISVISAEWSDKNQDTIRCILKSPQYFGGKNDGSTALQTNTCFTCILKECSLF
ncbi:PREDICTED: uncharacterized protein LOC104378252 [Tauraco erythrolophus]|uniref:uncharacterized protein LOC104378252 n=1 Tax=Tauraco erythrolophus TaxID=121530 RepID=UPI000523EC03|nr:PREDICTED: uncharacterized protein LOC104378252 [Tauraco erythrolophus]